MDMLRRGVDRTARGRASRPPRELRMSPEQSALLLNLLSDNARAWNAPLRVQLHDQVSGTEAFNAKWKLQQGEV